MRPSTLEFGNLTVKGRSVAGAETWFRVHPPGLAFEAGRGGPQVAGASDLFLSHGHLDHALGVPYVLSQRTRHQGKGTRLFCPPEVVADLEALIAAAGRLEASEYDYSLEGLAPGARVAVGRDMLVEAFATDHVLPSLGFHLIRCKRRLKPEHRGLPGHELGRLRAAGVATEDEVEELLLSYCGDTGAEVFEMEPRLYETDILLVECTFMGPERREHARLYKHVHFDDLVARAERFENRALVLHHLSRRFRVSDMRAAVERELPALAARIHLVGEPTGERASDGEG